MRLRIRQQLSILTLLYYVMSPKPTSSRDQSIARSDFFLDGSHFIPAKVLDAPTHVDPPRPSSNEDEVPLLLSPSSSSSSSQSPSPSMPEDQSRPALPAARGAGGRSSGRDDVAGSALPSNQPAQFLDFPHLQVNPEDFQGGDVNPEDFLGGDFNSKAFQRDEVENPPEAEMRLSPEPIIEAPATKNTEPPLFVFDPRLELTREPHFDGGSRHDPREITLPPTPFTSHLPSPPPSPTPTFPPVPPTSLPSFPPRRPSPPPAQVSLNPDSDLLFYPGKGTDAIDHITVPQYPSMTLKEVLMLDGVVDEDFILAAEGDDDVDCDEVLTSSVFYLRSPKYPRNYPNNVTCMYDIVRRSPDICGVQILVYRFDIARPRDVIEITHNGGDDCGEDTLTIGGKPLCGRYLRGETAVFPFTHSVLTVRFHSGFGHGASGFLIQGKQVKDCGRRATGNTGNRLAKELSSAVPCNRAINAWSFNLRSPGFPNNYPNNLECMYRIRKATPTICKISLSFRNFSLEEGRCIFDYLEVEEQRFCGTRDPFTETFEFPSEELLLRFRTDETTTRQGFSIQGEQLECEDNLEGTEESISTTDLGLPNDSATEFFLNFPTFPPLPIQPVTLNDTEGRSPDSDILSIPTSTDQTELTSVISTFPSVDTTTLDFPKEGIGAGDDDDFKTSLDPGLLTTDSNLNQKIPGEFPELDPTTTSQSFPGTPTNPDDLDLFPPTTFQPYPPPRPTNPSIPGHIPSSTDPGIPPPVFPIFPGTSTAPATPTIPGVPTYPTIPGLPPSSITPTTSSVSPGFPLPIAPNQVTGCNQLHVMQSYTLTSPGYPNRYPGNLDCKYTTRRYSGTVCAIRITFLDFDLDNPFRDPTNCLGDYLKIGGESLCGPQQGIRVFPFKDQLFNMYFHSDSSVSGRGFQLHVEQLTTECFVGPVLPPISPGLCDTEISQKGFTLFSPGYPTQYPPSSNCHTTIKKAGPDIQYIILEFTDFEMENSPQCSKDYLQVAGIKFCGTQSGRTRTLPFPGSTLDMFFHSDGDGKGRGYRIKVGQVSSANPTTPRPPLGTCGGVYVSPTVTISSPLYPSQYPNQVQCTYRFNKATSGICQLRLKLLDFDVEDSNDCSFDYLQVDTCERLCGQRYPGEARYYHFIGNQMDLIFRSDEAGSARGFRIEVAQVPCGVFYPSYPHHGHNHKPHANRPHRPNGFRWLKPWAWKWGSRTNHGYNSHYTTTTARSISTNTQPSHYGPPSTTSHTRPSSYGPPSTTRRSYTYRKPGHGGGYYHYNYCPYVPITPHPTFPPTTPHPTVSPTTPPFTLPPTPPPELLASPTAELLPTPKPIKIKEPTPPPGRSLESGFTPVVSPKFKFTSPDFNAKGVLDIKNASITSCDMEYQSRVFQITSPGYPGPSYAHMRCTYTVHRLHENICGARFEFRQFDLQKSQDCQESYLAMGSRRYCGQILPGAYGIAMTPGVLTLASLSLSHFRLHIFLANTAQLYSVENTSIVKGYWS
ncbi:cubilin-like [Oratosquilla oratoria]|uniref:cubilin-like n=1 Tax=Oratosquilla oratoria TaxID=337810 RepID=UPI003F7698B5